MEIVIRETKALKKLELRGSNGKDILSEMVCNLEEECFQEFSESDYQENPGICQDDGIELFWCDNDSFEIWEEWVHERKVLIERIEGIEGVGLSGTSPGEVCETASSEHGARFESYCRICNDALDEEFGSYSQETSIKTNRNR